MALYRRAHAADHFTQIPNSWVRDGKTRPNAKAVLSVLLSHDPGYALSIAQVCRETGLGRDGVNSAINHLRDRGYLIEVRQSRALRGQFAENDYELTDCWDRVPDEARHFPPTESGSAGPVDPDDTPGIRQDQPVRSQPVPAAPAPAGPDQRRTQGEEPRENTTTPPLPLGLPAASNGHRLAPVERFEEFWSAYPKKVGKDAARRAWGRAIKRADVDKIIDVVQRYPWRSERTYIKDPATWLNAGCWDDDLADVAAGNGSGRGSAPRPGSLMAPVPPSDTYTYGDGKF